MTEFDHCLNARLESIREEGLRRDLRRVDTPQSTRIEIDGKCFSNFSSNDYLGLANEPSIKEAAIRAVERFGAGSGASRLICGSLAPHHELESTLASFKGTEAALVFSSGYTAALGTICALLSNDDVIVIDKLVHACLVDAARLCGAKLRVFDHNDLNDLERILEWADRRDRTSSARERRNGKILIATESVFSMDGDKAPLRSLIELKEKFGAWLLLDEAHATGLYGTRRRGLAEQNGVSERIEIQMGTLGKALGASGGFICGSRVLVDYLINRARSFIFSTAPVPAAASAARAAIEFVQSKNGAERCETLWKRVHQFSAGRCAADASEEATESGSANSTSNIIPIILGSENAAVEAADLLRRRQIFVPAIRYPTVPRNTARLRITLTASHSEADIEELKSALAAMEIRPTIGPHA